MFMRNLICLVFFVFLVACSSLPKESEWPEQLPDKHYFISYYKQSVSNSEYQSLHNYLSWVVKFYEGTHLQPKGWLATSVDIIEAVPATEQEQLADQMRYLGQAISAEWAMDNRARKLNTRNMSVWGSAMREAIVQDDVINLVERIQQDVDDLLAGNLNKKQVTDDRYYASEYNEFF